MIITECSRFELGKKYHYRTNPYHTYRVIWEDDKGVLLESKDGLRCYEKHGNIQQYVKIEELIIKTGWINIYSGRRCSSYVYNTKDEARSNARDYLMDTVFFDWKEKVN